MKRDITPREEAERFKKLQDTLVLMHLNFELVQSVEEDEDEWPGRSEEIIKIINQKS